MRLRPTRPARLLAAGLLAAGLTLTGTAGSAGAAGGNASVSVFHGVPDTPVDVYANGDALLEDFQPGTITDPVSLPAGSYDLKVTAPGAGADGEAVIEANGVDVPAGANVTVAAHLKADGTPVLTPYVNDVSATAGGQGRLTVRHTAAAPAVDVRANGEVAFSDLTNPGEATADLPAGTVSADVVLAGTDEVAIGPADVDVASGVNTVVYAWGSADDGNLALAVQTLSAGPGGVPAGSGGAAAGTGLDPLVPAGLVAVLAGGLALLVTRRRADRGTRA